MLSHSRSHLLQSLQAGRNKKDYVEWLFELKCILSQTLNKLVQKETITIAMVGIKTVRI